jgi:adenylylsulfate kinase-like enzyme
MTGIDSPYERPVQPDIIIRADKTNIKTAVNKILDYLD